MVNEVVPGAANHALIAVFEGARNVKLLAVDSNLEIAGEESIKELSIERSVCAPNTDKIVCAVACDATSNKLNNFDFFILTTI